MKKYLSIGLICLAIVSCKDNKVKEKDTEPVTNIVTDTISKSITATAIISAKSNSAVSGTVTFTENEGMVSMVATLSGLAPGKHAIHIHEKGDCSANDGSSAGGHWNPTNEDHGIWGTTPFHKGDIGNIEIDAQGIGTISRDTDLWCIDCADTDKNIVGKAIIIHEGIDDFSSQPSGAAGKRAGCGEIVLEQK
ncbi:superoxide dismutase family protein [Flavobacterium jejuense]|uniref:Superoxide dismutase family protein n=1 Tax=Flavobacterium jejuense TaxID=1544455 RepID=A0ABX0ILL0_9FLAO|nr:superoxide dismutase family protein [Flavobacterium jejuense]NHN24483.1 superoxide dismutase family protein [Flavobacterium jejuense]